jgi:hypothetical protein
MKLEKIKKTYNDYKLELSWGQVEAIAQALEANHADPLADELFAEWKWYMERVPGPGEDEEAWEAQQKAAEGGGEPGAEGDVPIPMPPGSEAGTAPGASGERDFPPDEEAGVEPEGGAEVGPEAGPEGGAEVGLPEPEPETGPEAAPEGGAPAGEEPLSRLPKPPRE